MKLDYLLALVGGAVATTAVLAVLWLARVVTLKTGRSLAGLFWDFFGAIILGFGLLLQHMTVFRIAKDLMEQEGQVPKDWVHRFPVKIAFRLGSQDSNYTGETSTDSYGDIFWGLLLLALGFVLQVVSQIL
jgi:hypothetical protein